jgi:hypothetical protein
MEIKLQAYKNYGIADWDGTVEIFGLHILHSKRLANSRNLGALFRKMLKVYKDKLHSPLKLPDGLEPEDLDLGDFMQIAIGLAVLSGGKEFQQDITCSNPQCKTLNPRVISRLDVFTPIKPEIEGGKSEVVLLKSDNGREPKTEKAPVKEPAKMRVVCNYTSIKKYLDVYKRQENLGFDEAKTHEFYSKLLAVEDAEDHRDLKKIILDIGIVAEAIDIEEMQTFEEKLLWLAELQGEKSTKDYNKINETIAKLSTVINSDYKTECRGCGKELEREFQPTDYFFDMG